MPKYQNRGLHLLRLQELQQLSLLCSLIIYILKSRIVHTRKTLPLLKKPFDLLNVCNFNLEAIVIDHTTHSKKTGGADYDLLVYLPTTRISSPCNLA